MFFGDPVAAFTNIGRALRHGGRLVLLTWQPLAGNEWIRELSGAMAAGRELPGPPAGAPGPFALSEPEPVRSILGAAGFLDVELTATSARLWFGEEPDGAQAFVLGVLGWMLDGLKAGGRREALAALRRTLVEHTTEDGVLFGSSAWTIRATRG
jgi:SAM-dependent methyltransferase